MKLEHHDVFGFVKPYLDAHTLGINTIAELLRECNYKVIIGDEDIEKATLDFQIEYHKKIIKKWIESNNISRLGLSYRLDTDDAIKIVGQFVHFLRENEMLHYQGGPIKTLYFAGLPKTCELIEKEHKGLIKTFKGGESTFETLSIIGVPEERIPKTIIEGNEYDKNREAFAKEIIDSSQYEKQKPYDRSGYKTYGTMDDSVIERIDHNMTDNFPPLIRAHVGPYDSTLSRKENVQELIRWAEDLAQSGLLDILSIGTSQLTQSNFGEDWGDRKNGGGVPINSEREFRDVWEASRPMLVRTYAGTKNIPQLAEIYERTLNISWHALSLWWFNRLDERGPYDLYTNLQQHFETLKYIAKTNKPFEPNIPHHFAFRGADDVTYIVSAYLAAKAAKQLGVKTLIVQNMLNTPRSTWGIQDLAKSRALLTLVKRLEDENFRVLLQPRAGLDYFKPDLYEARIQLASVTALMDDIDPHNEQSPPIIHVVSYSEASHLATPDVIKESIKITHYTLQQYRKLRRQGNIDDLSKNLTIEERKQQLLSSAKKIIQAIEKHVPNPYSPEGFYIIFAAGFLPVPYLWNEVQEFRYAKAWKTKFDMGGVKIVNDESNIVPTERVIDKAIGHIHDAEYQLQRKYLNKQKITK